MPITVFVADDNVLIREGVRAMLAREDDLEIVGTATDYGELVAGAESAAPQVIVTDIRMPPNFQREGIEAAQQIRKRHPGTGVVVLSQYDDPEYVITLLGEGTDGYAYLLKDRIAEGDQLARAVRQVASGGSVLDPKIVDALMNPIRSEGVLSEAEEALLRQVAEGRSVKSIAAALDTTPAAVSTDIERLFAKLLAQGAPGAKRLQMLHQAIVAREELGEDLSTLLPTGIADVVRARGARIGETERLHVTVLMSDIRGYSTIAETSDPSVLAGQLNEHRAEMNRAILDNGGTVMQYVGDAVLAVFGAPVPTEDHADRALRAAVDMQHRQRALNERWEPELLPSFGLGLGLSTGEVAAALLGSEERLEYTVVGDTVNLAARIQQWAEPGDVICSQATWGALTARPAEAVELEPQLVKGRQTPVKAVRIATSGGQ